MKEQVSVSVIVPVYNAEKHILKTLRCLEQQTLRTIEVVLVDDASTDASCEVIENFCSQSQLNLKLIKLEQNQGAFYARLVGLRQAQGKWIGFVDSDDYPAPNMFERMYTEGKKHDVDIVMCGVDRVSSKGRYLSNHTKFKDNKKVTSADIFSQYCNNKFGIGGLWSKLYKREVIFSSHEMTLPWRQNLAEDYLLDISCFLRARSIFLLKDSLYRYSLNLQSATSLMVSAKSFVELFRAYALAVYLFRQSGDDVLLDITEFFRVRLSARSRSIEDLNFLINSEDRLKQAVALINVHFPLGLALITARHRAKPKSVKKLFSALIFKLTERLRRYSFKAL